MIAIPRLHQVVAGMAEGDVPEGLKSARRSFDYGVSLSLRGANSLAGWSRRSRCSSMALRGAELGILISVPVNLVCHVRGGMAHQFHHVLRSDSGLGANRPVRVASALGSSPDHFCDLTYALGLYGPHLISGTKAPRPLRLRDVLMPGVRNTAAFILRMHFAILVFALLVASARWLLPVGAAPASSRPPAAAANAAARVSP